jgi:hypothetical protein
VALLTVVIVAAVGVNLLATSHAASPYASVEANSGILAGGATQQTDSSTADGSYVQFGTPPTSSNFSPLIGVSRSSPYSLADIEWWEGPTASDHHADIIDVFDGGTSWSILDGDSSTSGMTNVASVASEIGAQVEYTVGMYPSGGTSPNCQQDPQDSTTVFNEDAACMAAAAAGDYNSYFTELGNNLVASGLSKAIIRLGQECNGDFDPWSIFVDPSGYIQAYQNEVTALRAAAGQDFLFSWNCGSGSINGLSSTPGTTYYPGNAYVDFISADLYDGDGSSCPTTSNEDITSTMSSLEQFAAQPTINKYLAFDEWGLWYGSAGSCTDDPTFIQNMYNFISNPANRVGYAIYLEQSTSAMYYSNLPETNGFPNSSAEYTKLFSQLPNGYLPSGL